MCATPFHFTLNVYVQVYQENWLCVVRSNNSKGQMLLLIFFRFFFFFFTLSGYNELNFLKNKKQK